MKKLLIAVIASCSPIFVFCQDITGLWSGSMLNDSTQQSLPYEIFISKSKGKYSGFSQTWFMVDDKKYYGIKKINVRIAKDGKIVIQDGAAVENNSPVNADKNVIQLNVLDLVSQGNETILNGPFVTNRSKAYRELTGRISLKRISSSEESSLVKYLQKNYSDNDITGVR